MSLAQMLRPSKVLRFRRVSGDEPSTQGTQVRRCEFSPRERG